MVWEKVVARNVRRLRIERGLTQEELGFEADVALRYIGMIERAETSATVGMLGKLADALGVALEDLLRAAPAEITPLTRYARSGVTAKKKLKADPLVLDAEALTRKGGRPRPRRPRKKPARSTSST
jgi:transcriptional regulator with XRE-family HTH domain